MIERIASHAPACAIGARFVCALLCSSIMYTRVAQADVPALSVPVDDRADLLPDGAERMLRDDLRALETRTGHQFALLTLNSLEGADMERYARDLVAGSKLGRATGHDDGLLLMIVKEGNLVGLHLGRDLKAAIPDATALAQIREDLEPAIKRGAAVEGIFVVFQRWTNAVGGIAASSPAASARAPAEDGAELEADDAIQAAVAAKVAKRAERASALTFHVPALRGAVNDHAGLLSGTEQKQLEQTLRAFRAQAGPQFALLTVRSLAGLAVEDYAMKVVESWQLGRAGTDDGLLLLVAKEERKLRIEVGYGLEGSIPDAVAARILRNTLEPAFKRGLFAQGIASAFDQLMYEVDGQPHARPARRAAAVARHAQSSDSSLAGNAILTLFALFFGSIFVFSFVRFWRGEGVFLGFYFDENRKLRMAATRSGPSSEDSESPSAQSTSSSSSSGSSSSGDSDYSGEGGRFGGGGASGSW